MYSKSSFSVTNFAKEIPHYEHEKTTFPNKGVTYVTEWGHRASNKFKKCILKSSKSVESLNGPNGIFLKLYDVIYHIGPHSGDEPKIGNFSIYPLFHFLIFL